MEWGPEDPELLYEHAKTPVSFLGKFRDPNPAAHILWNMGMESTGVEL